jgi:hypothetical protein
MQYTKHFLRTLNTCRFRQLCWNFWTKFVGQSLSWRFVHLLHILIGIVLYRIIYPFYWDLQPPGFLSNVDCHVHGQCISSVVRTSSLNPAVQNPLLRNHIFWVKPFEWTTTDTAVRSGTITGLRTLWITDDWNAYTSFWTEDFVNHWWLECIHQLLSPIDTSQSKCKNFVNKDLCVHFACQFINTVDLILNCHA